MCTYNGAQYLEEQLASLVSQSRMPDELIVCDDCSTDVTRSVLTNFAATSPVKIKVKTNSTRLGSTRNFEQAISLCDGDIIALCDQDDVWLPDKLRLMEECFRLDPQVALVFSDAELVDQDGHSMNKRLWDAYSVDAEKLGSDKAYEVLDRREVITGTTMAFRASFRKLVLPIPENIPVIHDAWIAHLIAHAGNLKPIATPLINYRQHSSQQVGAPTQSLQPRSTVSESARRETDFDQELRRVENVLQRMDECAGMFEFKGRQNVEDIVTHFKMRKALPENKLAYLPQIFRELLTGRYHRYSKGFSSFVKDLVR
jgi:glycosyltransferase involved in cell wall biosynthesis